MQAQRWLHRLHELGCTVLLSTELQHEAVVRLCQQRRIALIHSVSATDATRVCHHTGALPIFHLSDLTTNPAALGRAHFVRQIAVGGRIAIHIDAGKATSFSPSLSAFHPHTILLAAPSDGIGQQYRQAMMRGFAALGQFVRVERAFVVGGAGALELALSRHCAERAEACRRDGVKAWMGWRLMAAALMAVPRTLYDNACRGEPTAPSRFVELLSAISGLQHADDGRPQHFGLVQRHPRQCDVDHFEQRWPSSSLTPPSPPGIAALRLPLLTSVVSAVDAGVVESPAGRHHVISALLSTLRTLLRIETAVAVRSLEGRSNPHGRLVSQRGGHTARRGRGWVGRSTTNGEPEEDSDSDEG